MFDSWCYPEVALQTSGMYQQSKWEQTRTLLETWPNWADAKKRQEVRDEAEAFIVVGLPRI